MPKESLTIGVTTLHGDDAWVQRNTQNYLNILAAHGVRSVVLSPDQPARLPDGSEVRPDGLGRLPSAILESLDGLILSGGGDVAPHYFGEELSGAEPDNIRVERDELELALARAALDMDIPLFGICRGCQVLNVAAGGKMIQHLDGHRSPGDSTAYHDVHIVSTSRFRQIVGHDVLKVNTFHHQGIDRASMAPTFVPVAMAYPDDWLVEAYESPRHRWVVGVQWHPERVFELSDPHQALWQGFLAACQARAQQPRS